MVFNEIKFATFAGGTKGSEIPISEPRTILMPDHLVVRALFGFIVINFLTKPLNEKFEYTHPFLACILGLKTFPTRDFFEFQ